MGAAHELQDAGAQGGGVGQRVPVGKGQRQGAHRTHCRIHFIPKRGVSDPVEGGGEEEEKKEDEVRRLLAIRKLNAVRNLYFFGALT